MPSLNAPASSLSLFQTSSDIQFEDRILAYYYEVGTSGKALKCHIILAVLWLCYLFLYIRLQLKLCGVPTRLLNFSISYGKIMTLQCSQ